VTDGHNPAGGKLSSSGGIRCNVPNNCRPRDAVVERIALHDNLKEDEIETGIEDADERPNNHGWSRELINE
jgi:hypothetical protein